jgi:hypothetical protein
MNEISRALSFQRHKTVGVFEFLERVRPLVGLESGIQENRLGLQVLVFEWVSSSE